MSWQEKTQLLTGEEVLQKLKNASVLVAGLGGVGGAAAEMLARAGVGNMTIVDSDTVHPTNLNRQILSLNSNIGKKKVELWQQRLLDINPQLKLTIFDEFIRDEKMIEILDRGYDYVIDAIDTLSPKVFLIYHCVLKQLPIVSSMGAGGKVDPTQVEISDISESHTCRLAYNIRKRLHRFGIQDGVTVVFSGERVPKESVVTVKGEPNKITTVGTISYMPNVFGCFCASVVIRNLAGLDF